MKSLLLQTLLPSAVLAVLTASAFAAPAAAPLICPVTGEKIASPAAAAGHETYKGKTYYFCCSGCQPIFDKNRDKIIADAAHGKHQ